MTTDLKVNDVVQIDPAHDPVFGACLMVVTEPKVWGAQGYIPMPQHPRAALAYYRCPHSAMHLIGHAEWVQHDEGELVAPAPAGSVPGDAGTTRHGMLP